MLDVDGCIYTRGTEVYIHTYNTNIYYNIYTRYTLYKHKKTWFERVEHKQLNTTDQTKAIDDVSVLVGKKVDAREVDIFRFFASKVSQLLAPVGDRDRAGSGFCR